jgi:hypothetical protein
MLFDILLYKGKYRAGFPRQLLLITYDYLVLGKLVDFKANHFLNSCFLERQISTSLKFTSAGSVRSEAIAAAGVLCLRGYNSLVKLGLISTLSLKEACIDFMSVSMLSVSVKVGQQKRMGVTPHAV